MTTQFKEKLDTWLGSQNTLGESLSEFKKMAASYLEGDHAPAELLEKMESLENNVGRIKGEFLGVLEAFFDLQHMAHGMKIAEKKKTAGEEVEKASAPREEAPDGTLHIETVPKKEAVEVEDDKDPGTLPSLPTDVPPSERPMNGILGYMNYAEWFYNQPEESQKEIAAIFMEDPRFKIKDLLETPITFLPPKMASFLWQTANKLMAEGHEDIATALLIKGLTIVTDKADKEMLHIVYAKYFYKKRKELKDAYMGCISHCEKAIKSFLSDSEMRNKPIAPFKLLTKIYEEQEELQKILKIADKAIKLYENSPSPERAEGFRKIREVLAQQGIE